MSEASAPAIATDLADAAKVIAGRGLVLGSPLVLAELTSSTNDDAKQAARAGAPHGALWVAEAQTSGRGRQGRTWLSSPRANLLFSVLMRLRCAPARVPPVSLAVGLAVRDAVARALGAAHGTAGVIHDRCVVVKWPNDVLVRSPHDGVLRKVAGVLVESALSGHNVEYVVVGIGINVRARTLPPEVAAIATSIALERDARGARGEPDRAELLADVLAGLERDVELVAHKGLTHLHARLGLHDALAGREVESLDDPPTVRGVASGIDAEGRLLVKSDDGTLSRVSSGELRVRVT
jgi:BirA family biotin operon repressor/biotin-[acetyl-CoA-carboxylase] ligase